jgi:hypothetical protein
MTTEINVILNSGVKVRTDRWDGKDDYFKGLAAINEIASLPPAGRGGELLFFTDDELAEARRLLLPNHMSHHDTEFEAQLRTACDRADRRRRGVLGMR